MKIKQGINPADMHYSIDPRHGETVEKVLLNFMAKAMKDCFSAQALPFPLTVDPTKLKKEICIPPKNGGSVILPFYHDRVLCDLTVTRDPNNPMTFYYAYLCDRHQGTITIQANQPLASQQPFPR